jgi:hypothetical protein
MRIILARLAALLALALAPTPALAWWEYGHQTVARIAWLEVRPEIRTAIERLLRQSALLETPTCPARTIEEIAVWPDCIKQLRDRFSYAYSWHFEDVDICRPYDRHSACANGNCITAQIERSVRLLKDRHVPVRERVMALAFLVHLVGDLHQPLHASDHHDRGGNDLLVAYGAIAGRTNLHSIWDGLLADRAISTLPGGAEGILSGLSAADRQAMRGGTLDSWARESWQLSRDAAYGSVLEDPCATPPQHPVAMDEAMIERLIPVVRQQVARGGERLARLLDEALG